jgi:hypothetical protein
VWREIGRAQNIKVSKLKGLNNMRDVGFEVFRQWLRKVSSSGMWRCVGLVKTKVSEENVTSNYSVNNSVSKGNPPE